MSNFSSRTHSPISTVPARSQPLRVDSSGKTKEKKDMVSLNDKFVKLIEKVKALENEKRVLTTKLKILKEQEDYTGKVDDLVRQEENQLEQQIETLLNDNEKLKEELSQNMEEVEDTKTRYEQVLEKKGDIESEFVMTKSNVDQGHLDSVELAIELEELIGKLDFIRAGHDEEIKELESQVQNRHVILPDTEKRNLDMEEVVKTIEVQYATMAARTRDEAEQWNQKKMDALVFSAEQREQEARDIKREVSDMMRLIQRLNSELDSLKRKEESIRKEIEDTRQGCDDNLQKAKEDIAKLEDALRMARQDLARMIREHQELLNLKLGLDIEIATYHKLLEGEEKRMNYLLSDVHLPSKLHPPPEKPQTAHPTSTPTQDMDIVPADFTKKKLLIRVQVESGRVVSESSHYTE